MPTPQELLEQQTKFLYQIAHKEEKGRFGFEKHIWTGAMIATGLGALAALAYLVTTATMFSNNSMLSFVIGTNHNMEELASEALFVVFTRFILVFSLTWAPATLGTWIIAKITGR